ncbi:hypothetical protein ACFQY3_17790 [Paenibacillus farraposensis]|uniref:hypothetical protein n=1 Tax=Paenibacillus farraposensis TaxID=2807095 RepID=UPI00361A28FC
MITAVVRNDKMMTRQADSPVCLAYNSSVIPIITLFQIDDSLVFLCFGPMYVMVKVININLHINRITPQNRYSFSLCFVFSGMILISIKTCFISFVIALFLAVQPTANPESVNSNRHIVWK